MLIEDASVWFFPFSKYRNSFSALDSNQLFLSIHHNILFLGPLNLHPPPDPVASQLGTYIPIVYSHRPLLPSPKPHGGNLKDFEAV